MFRRVLSNTFTISCRAHIEASKCKVRHWSLYSKPGGYASNFLAYGRRSLSTDAMADEYGHMDSSGLTYRRSHYKLESGEVLPEVEVRYKSYGNLNEGRDNVIVVCHALTGNASLGEWWPELLGPGMVFDTDKYFIVCANALGSCYGSTGPQSIDPRTGKKYGNDFPHVTVRDTVGIHMENLKEGLGVKSVHAVIGGSFGGMQALEWAIMGGSYVKKAVVIGCGAQHDAWQIAISETQRQMIYADEKWNGGDVDMSDTPQKGLSLARQIAMVSYRTAAAYNSKFGRSIQDKETIDIEKETKEGGDAWAVKSYLEYQGEKFLSRFDAVTYLKVTHQMDSHDVGRGRGGVKKALADMKAQVMVVGIDSDMLYPLQMQQELHALIPSSVMRSIRSDDGHDGFLLAYDQLGAFIDEFL